jgi:aryl-alcohol dehydrogenase-like predicted oxidoreductase
MEYSQLGTTDLRISRIGFGCWAIGGHGYGQVDDRQSIKAIRRALDLGINFFDTADVYGFGHSEEILGRGLGSQKNNVVIATKFGVRWDKNGKVYKDCSPKIIFAALDESLRRLKIDAISLYQIHWHDGVTPIYDIMEALQKCQQMGKVRHIGCSNFQKSLVDDAFKIQRLESLQILYNIVQRNTQDLITYCAGTLKMGILAYGVLGRGLLTGKYGTDAKFGYQDTRGDDENFRREKLLNNLQIVSLLRKIAIKYNQNSSQVAIRWVLDHPDITCAITGIKTSQQIEDNVKSLEFKLSGEDYNQIANESLKINDR